MECIRPFQYLGIFYFISIVAFDTFFRRTVDHFRGVVAFTTGDMRGFVIFGVVVTVVAGKTVFQFRSVGFVIEQDLSGDNFVHQSNGFIRGFFWKRSITKDTDKQEV